MADLTHGATQDSPSPTLRISRRRFLSTTATAAGTLALSGAPAWAGAARPITQAHATLPPPGSSGIEHIVLVMMENRSFDHFLGWLPGATGRQAGLTYTDTSGVAHSTYHLTTYQGCGHPDPDHSFSGGRVEYDGGACDGWLRAGSNDVYAIGYYMRHDLAFLGKAAPGWTSLDSYFAPKMAPTYPNRMYQHAAQTDRLDQSTTLSTLPTIWDRLAAAGLTGHYYYSDVPFLALWGTKYLPISRSFAAFLADCAAGTLPQVSFVDPRFVDESSGTSADDHPHADIRNGEAFLNMVYHAVTSSPNWPSTVLVINYDEWGGFFEHVAPALAPIPPADPLTGNLDGLRGFRVPCLLIAPWARRGYVAHATYDHTSVLSLIEWRWGLQPLTIRDQTANNLAAELNFGHPQLNAPTYDVPPGPFGGACAPGGPSSSEEWAILQALAQSYGWPIY